MTKFEVTEQMVDEAEDAYNRLSGDEPICYRDAMRAAITAAIEASGLVEENARLREALRKIEDTEYINQLSGNMNFEILQSFALEALNKEPTP
jgi:hypothetical protein